MAALASTLKLTLLDQVSARAKVITRSLDAMTQRTNGMLAMTRSVAAFAATYVGVTEGVEHTYTAAEKMQASLTEVAIKAGMSNQHLEAMQRQLTALSPKVNQTTADLLSGVDAMVTLGLATDKAQESIPAIAKAATATGASIADLAGASTSAIQNMGVLPEQITKMLDAMALAGNAGAFELKNMAEFFPQLTASAQALGIDGVDGVADLAAALQIARRGAGDASTAANNLANFLGKIMSPEVSKNFKRFGIDVTKELKRAHKQGISPIEHFIKLVDEKTKGGQADLLGQLFGDRQVQDFVRPMIADLKHYVKIREQAERANGTVDSAFARRMQDNAQKVKAFRIAMENLGTAIGGTMLKPVADFADRMARILNTLDERATVFDKVSASLNGFLNGIGVGNLSGLGDALEKFIFGVQDGSKAADEMGRIFARFQEYGRQVREFGSDVADAVAKVERFFGLKPGKAGETLGTVAGYGLTLGAASIGIGLAASAIGGLATALLRLSGVSFLLGGAKGLAKLFGAISGFPTLGGNPATSPNSTSKNTPNVPPGAWFGNVGRWMKGLGVMSLIPASAQMLQDTPGDSFEDQVAIQAKRQDALRRLFGLQPYAVAHSPAAVQAEQDAGRRTQMGVAQQIAIQGAQFPGKAKDDFDIGRPKTVTIDAASISAMIQPSGTQSVRVENQQIPSVTVTNSFTITGVADPQAAASSAASKIGAEVKRAVASADTD